MQLTIKITSGTSEGPYSIFYDGSGNLATNTNNGQPCQNLYRIDFSSGLNISIPDNANFIRIKNDCAGCGTYVDHTIPGPTPSITPTNTPSITPSITPTNTPSTSQYPTPTPSITPSSMDCTIIGTADEILQIQP